MQTNPSKLDTVNCDTVNCDTTFSFSDPVFKFLQTIKSGNWFLVQGKFWKGEGVCSACGTTDVGSEPAISADKKHLVCFTCWSK